MEKSGRGYAPLSHIGKIGHHDHIIDAPSTIRSDPMMFIKFKIIKMQ
ncbi:MAG: hypothetical protein ACTSWW_01320 [Promethearchaeota archaeon]